jgi:hypothetical protein
MPHDERHYAGYGEEPGLEGRPVPDDRIKVVCHGCGARYQVRASKVQGRRFRASCKKCGGIIVAHCSNAFTVLPDSGSGSPRQSNPLQLERDDLYQEEEGWYVVISGKPHGPLSVEQVRQSVESGRIGERTYLWRAGDPEWRRLGEVPEFMDLSGGQTSYYQGVQPHRRDSRGRAGRAPPAGIRARALRGGPHRGADRVLPRRGPGELRAGDPVPRP